MSSSSAIDPAKLKVVDLRNQLASRGLDTKGNKAVLVKRLKDALEKELETELPDSSILETSTEDADMSLTETAPVNDENVKMEVDKEPDEPVDTEPPEVDQPVKQEPKTSEPVQKMTVVLETMESSKGESEPSKEPIQVKVEKKPEENGEAKLQSNIDESENVKVKTEKVENEQNESSEVGKEGGSEQKGEKRKRSSASPERSQKRRSRSPIREDEPTIDIENVHLNWYDSDLHLQVDKEKFLSAKPLTEGAFGFAWAGVRASHGISFGKVCYEVKLTEELKWEDFSRYPERSKYDRRNSRRDKDRRDSSRRDSEKDKSKSKSDEHKDKSTKEDSENKNDKPEEKPGDEEKKNEDSIEKQDEMVEEASEKKEEDASEKKEDETEMKEEESEEKQKQAEGEEKSGEKMEEDSEEKKDGEEASEEKKEEAEEKKDEVEIPSHLIRIGWSLVSNSLQLGEEKFSYGYESTGKFVTEKMFVEYEKPFKVGDVVGAFLDINENDVKIRYTLNGEVLSVAITVLKSEFPEDFALFPHILTRNYAFEVNVGDNEEPWFPIPEELKDYTFITEAENKVVGPLRPENRKECEVILMCGLPATGKTHWVKEHVQNNLEKRYTIIGNTALLEKMTVAGEPLKSKYKGRWATLIDRLQKCLNKLISIAAVRRRNYIIDQTNVFPSAQRRKMRPFEGFLRKAVVIVLGDEDQSDRQAIQEALDGKEVPDSTILEMKASMSLPEKGEWLEEVLYAGLGEEEAKEQVKKYNATGKAAGFGGDKRFHRDRWQNKRSDYRGRNYRDRGYQTQRYDARGRWQPRGRGGGPGGWRDRRDMRRPLPPLPPPNRDWRGSNGGNRGRDRGGSRENHNRTPYQGGSGNRQRGQGWSGNWGGQGGWNQQTFGHGNYGNWGNSGNAWKYGNNQGGYGGYGGNGNWNYYGQYPQQQNWSNQK